MYLNLKKMVLSSRVTPLPTGERRCLICGIETDREGVICNECEAVNIALLPPEERPEVPNNFTLKCHKCGTPVHPKLVESILGKGRFFKAGTYLCKFCRDAEPTTISQEQMDRLREKWGVATKKEKKRK